MVLDRNKKQRTIARAVEFQGVGLHTGDIIPVRLAPAAANAGITFHRTDIPGSKPIPATAESVFDTSLATTIGSPECAVSTVEHFLSALYGLGIDNVSVYIGGPEMPIFDGSAVPFLTFLDAAGVEILEANKKTFVIKETIEVIDPKNPERFVRIEPSANPKISYGIDFHRSQVIGQQFFTMDFNGKSFCQDVAFARTFCLSEDVEKIKSLGLAKGGSLDNAIVVDKNNVKNANGLRSDSEFVQHKILDLIGDFHLNQFLVLGHVYAHMAGHDLHTAMAKKLSLAFKLAQAAEKDTAQNSEKIFRLFPAPEALSQIVWPVKGFALG